MRKKRIKKKGWYKPYLPKGFIFNAIRGLENIQLRETGTIQWEPKATA